MEVRKTESSSDISFRDEEKEEGDFHIRCSKISAQADLMFNQNENHANKRIVDKKNKNVTSTKIIKLDRLDITVGS